MGKPHEALGFRCEGKRMKMLMVQVFWYNKIILFSVFVERISQKTFCTNIWCFLLPLPFLHPFLLLCTDEACSNDDFSLAIFWSDYCISKLITIFQHRLLNPDILTR